MKKALSVILSIVTLVTLLTVVSLAKTVEFKDDYVGKNEFVVASFGGLMPIIENKDYHESLEESCYWLADYAEKLNLKYLGFVGNLTPGANYLYNDVVKVQGKTRDELIQLNVNDKEWAKEFEVAKKAGNILSDAGIPYGISIGCKDYTSNGYDRTNLIQTVFTMDDFIGNADVKTEVYDNNNFAVLTSVGKQFYVIYQLEAYPRTKTIEWFYSIQEKYPYARAIVYTTSLINEKGVMYTQHEWETVKDYASVYKNYNTTIRSNMLNSGQPREGDQLWNKAFKGYDNILCIFTGNAPLAGKEIVTSIFENDNGYPILTVVTSHENGYGANGQAYPVIAKISEDNKTIELCYAVPYYKNVGGYIEESVKVIELDKVATLPAPNPVTVLNKIEFQSNGNNTSYIKGYDNNLFKPNNNMTKAEACTIFARLLTKSTDIPGGYETRFTDVKPEDWFYKAIAYLDANGYLYSAEGNKYDPNAKITRAEFVELAYLTSNLTATNSATFNDVPETSKYYDAIMAAAASGLVKGYGDDTFKPNATITRAEVVTVINRLLALVVDEIRVSKSRLEKVFSDISGHWAEYQILMASNDNVRGEYSYNIDRTVLKETNSTVYFENDKVKVSINKNGGTVAELLNKDTDKNALALSSTPWFTYLLSDTNAPIQPKTVEIEDGRLKVTYKNKLVAYFIVEVKEDYFSVTLDSNIPSSVAGIVICQLSTNEEWVLNSDKSYGLSGVAMTTTVDPVYYAGGSSLIAKGVTYTYLGAPIIGSKFGVVFSKMSEHRECLKNLTSDIDKNYGLKSTRGGAFTYDNDDINGDYITISDNFNIDNAEYTAQLCKEYSVDEIHIHQGASSFTTGDFNFVCARTDEEASKKVFVDAKTFKERMGQTFIDNGIHLDLHSFSTLVHPLATSILSDPKWQEDIKKGVDIWTLEGNLSKARTNIKTYEDASNFQCTTSAVPYETDFTQYILIDEEIIKVQQGTSSGFLNVKRGQCGTTAVTHKDGTKIYQLLGHYGCFQPVVLSDLFYHVAENTAKAFNEGGFDMIYLDGFESFARDNLSDTRIKYYVYAEFLRTLLLNCNHDPFIEMSTIQPSFWAVRGRGGAVDFPIRAYKDQMKTHITSQMKYFNYFYTATAGWFNYGPDRDLQYKDTSKRTLHRDDLDHMGSLALANDFGTVCNGFNAKTITDPTRFSKNFMYYGTYTRLREGNYFAPEVKEAILNGKYEYKVFKQNDGSWAFKEMQYQKHKIFDTNDANFKSSTITNPFHAQTPFIRIEQNYTSNDQNNGVVLFDFDETKPVTSLNGVHKLTATNPEDNIIFKLRVYGNGSKDDALLISLASVTTSTRDSHDYFVPLNFTGWKEIILAETNNEEYFGYVFNNITDTTSAQSITYRTALDYDSFKSVNIRYAGSCAGVLIDTLTSYAPIDAPVKNPSITIGGETITFEAEVHSSEYIEYYPEYNKAYLNYYTQIYDENGKWKGDEAHTKEINFSGSVTAPNGKFSFTYNSTPLTEATSRAQVVFGFSGGVIANPEGWIAPEIDMPTDIEKVALY